MLLRSRLLRSRVGDSQERPSPTYQESALRYVNRSYRTENYQLVRPVLENRLAALQVDLNEVQVELFASKEQHMMQLYCSRYLNNAYRFYSKSVGLCYANPPFSQLAKVLTKSPLKEREWSCVPRTGVPQANTPIGDDCWTA